MTLSADVAADPVDRSGAGGAEAAIAENVFAQPTTVTFATGAILD